MFLRRGAVFHLEINFLDLLFKWPLFVESSGTLVGLTLGLAKQVLFGLWLYIFLYCYLFRYVALQHLSVKKEQPI